MWNLRGVAGNLRANLKQFATDVMQEIDEPEDEDDDTPRSQQEHQHAWSSQPLPGPVNLQPQLAAPARAPVDRLTALKARIEASKAGGPTSASRSSPGRQSEGFSRPESTTLAAPHRHTADAVPASNGNAILPSRKPITSFVDFTSAAAASRPATVPAATAMQPAPSNGNTPVLDGIPLQASPSGSDRAAALEPSSHAASTQNGDLHQQLPPATSSQSRQEAARQPNFSPHTQQDRNHHQLQAAAANKPSAVRRVPLQASGIPFMQPPQASNGKAASWAVANIPSHTHAQQQALGSQQEAEQTPGSEPKQADVGEAAQKQLQQHHAEHQRLQQQLQHKSELHEAAQTQLQAAQQQLANLIAQNESLQQQLHEAATSHAAKQQAEAERERSASAVVPELRRRLEKLTQDQVEAAEAARERDDAWRQELEAQREAAEAVQAQLQARLQAAQGSEAQLREAAEASELRCEALERRRAVELQAAAGEAAAERDAVWQQRQDEQRAMQQELQGQLEAQEASASSREQDACSVAEARAQMLQAREEAGRECSRADQLAQVLEARSAALEAAQSAAHAAESAHEDAESDLRRQLAQQQSQCSRLQEELADLQAVVQQQQQAEARSVSELDVEAAAQLQEELAAACRDRDGAKQQLSRLKQQLVAEQEDEEEKVRWRVEAEVKLLREELQAEEAARAATSSTATASLQTQLQAAHERIERMDADLNAWEAAVSSRDLELANLQAALGELTYESEAAERLRAEVRSVQRSLAEAQAEAASAKEAEAAAVAARDAASAQLQAAQEHLHQQTARESRTNEEAAMLRRAVGEGMRKVADLASDSTALVDRRIVAKLLVTYHERGRSLDILALMARMLGLSEEDKQKIGLARQRQGMLRSLSGLPGSLVKGVVGGDSAKGRVSRNGGDSLATQWLDFLIEEAEMGGEQHNDSGTPRLHAGSVPSSPAHPGRHTVA